MTSSALERIAAARVHEQEIRAVEARTVRAVLGDFTREYRKFGAGVPKAWARIVAPIGEPFDQDAAAVFAAALVGPVEAMFGPVIDRADMVLSPAPFEAFSLGTNQARRFMNPNPGRLVLPMPQLEQPGLSAVLASRLGRARSALAPEVVRLGGWSAVLVGVNVVAGVQADVERVVSTVLNTAQSAGVDAAIMSVS